LYVDVRGLTTRRLHHRGATFEMTLDFLDHAVVVRTADGRTRSFELGDGVPVADFDARLHALLAELGIDVEIKEEPFGVPMTTPATPPTTPTRHRSPRDSATSRSPWALGPSPAPARSRCCPTRTSARRPTPGRPCSRSARAPTRPGPASPAGTPPASSRDGVPRRVSSSSSRSPPRTRSAVPAPDR